MPRANRYILAGYIYHLTHRCHDRRFLLKFAKDRDGYRKRLRQAVEKHQLSLLSYNVTCNHVHLLAFSEDVEQIAHVMQAAAGEFARDYNRRKKRSGAFWEGRYEATLVEGGHYLWECLKYIELNMVRCGAVKHPRDWQWSGYHELMGQRRRNRLLDLEKLRQLLGNPSLEEFQLHFEQALLRTIAQDRVKRQGHWTESLAVGSQSFVETLEPKVRNRQQTQRLQTGNTWVLQEGYGAF